MSRRIGEAGCASFDEETAESGVASGPDYGDVGEGAVGDPGFLTVEDPMRSVAHGAGAHGGRIGAEVRFRQTEAADGLTGLQPRQPVRFLIFGAVLQNRIHYERALD